MRARTTERPNRVKLLRCQVAKERELFIKRSRSALIKHIVDSIRQVSDIVNRPLIAGGIGVDVAAGPSREAGRAEGGSSTGPRRSRTSARTRATINCDASVVECIDRSSDWSLIQLGK